MRKESTVPEVEVPAFTESMTERGKEVTEALLQKIGDYSFNKLEGVKTVDVVSPKWENRPKSNLVKWLMDKSDISLDDLAAALGYSPSYLNNKFHRDSFSLEDLIVVAYICGFSLTFTSNNPDQEKQESYQIDVKEFFSASDADTLMKIVEYEQNMKKRKKAEYDELKAKLEKLKAEFGFED